MSELKKITEQAFLDITCPVCYGHKAKKLFNYLYSESQSFILECVSCEHLWINPVPLVKLDSRSMDFVDDGELFNNSILRAIYRKLVILSEIQTIKKLKGKILLRLLDIACGTGWTTSVWQEKGFDVLGLESSEVRSSYCR